MGIWAHGRRQALVIGPSQGAYGTTALTTSTSNNNGVSGLAGLSGALQLSARSQLTGQLDAAVGSKSSLSLFGQLGFEVKL